MSEASFRVAWCVKTLLHQFVDSFLSSRPFHGSKESIPFGCDLAVGRQACNIDELLGFPNCVLIKGSDTGCERVDKSIELGIGQRSIHIPVELGEVTVDVVRAQKNLESAPSAHQAWQPRHRAATGHEAGTDFPLG